MFIAYAVTLTQLTVATLTICPGTDGPIYDAAYALSEIGERATNIAVGVVEEVLPGGPSPELQKLIRGKAESGGACNVRIRRTRTLRGRVPEILELRQCDAVFMSRPMYQVGEVEVVFTMSAVGNEIRLSSTDYEGLKWYSPQCGASRMGQYFTGDERAERIARALPLWQGTLEARLQTFRTRLLSSDELDRASAACVSFALRDKQPTSFDATHIAAIDRGLLPTRIACGSFDESFPRRTAYDIEMTAWLHEGGTVLGAYSRGAPHGTWRYYPSVSRSFADLLWLPDAAARSYDLELEVEFANGNIEAWRHWPSGGTRIVPEVPLTRSRTRTCQVHGIREASIGRFMEHTTEGVVRSWHDNGAMASRGMCDAGKASGQWEYWHDNGLLRAVGPFEDGEARGEWQVFWRTGRLASRGTIPKGRHAPNWTRWAPDGVQLGCPEGTTQREYDEGLHKLVCEGERHRESYLVEYDENATLVRERIWDKGFERGQWAEYHPSGSLATLGEYTDKYCNDGARYSHNRRHRYNDNYSYILDPQRTGLWTSWHPNGARASEGFYLPCVGPIGRWTHWHDNGAVSGEGEYVDGQREGEWRSYARDGRLLSSTAMDDGTGSWIVWGDDDQERAKGSLSKGLAVGDWTVWIGSERARWTGNVPEEHENATWTLWDEHGTPVRTEVRIRGRVASAGDKALLERARKALEGLEKTTK